MTRRAVWLPFLALAAGLARTEPVPPPGVVEHVEVRSFYLCEDYSSFGDASFYDCARRFFQDAAQPVNPDALRGQWLCRSAFNGPSANWQQPVLVAHYQRKGSKSRAEIDRLLVMQSSEPLPAKKVRRWVGQAAVAGDMVIHSVAGEIVRGTDEWISTPWGYGEKPVGFDIMGGPRELYDQRAAFRVHEDRLLLEHVVREKEKQRLIELLRHQVAPRDELADRVNRVAREVLLEGETYFRPSWTEQSLRTAAPLASFGDDWTLPILYSECRRPGGW